MKNKVLFSLSLVGLLCSCGTPQSGGTSAPGASSGTSGEAASSGASEHSVASSESEAQTSGSEGLPDIDYVKVFAPKNYTRIWAWTKDESGVDHNYFTVPWPGEEMASYDSEWNTFDFTDCTSIYVIVSIDGQSQTPDTNLASPGYWWFVNHAWTQENPWEKEEDSSAAESTDSDDSQYIPPSGDLDNRHRTWYQLLVYSFADGNGDGVGDFKGIVNHLDYLEKLGIRGLWLSPIHPAKSYHGYDVRDYKAVRSEYEVDGYTFDKLLQECHKRDIKVILDMVLNHTSDDHPWTWEHSDYYSGEHVFGGGMPDLNYENSELRGVIKDIGKYWLGKGVDGFRCDGAAWIYGGGGGWNVEEYQFNRTVQWWSEFSAACREVRSDVYLVGEVYTELHWIEEYYKAKMSAFNFSASYWAKDAMQNGNASNWISEYVGHQSRVRNNDSAGVEASFLSNHDIPRFASNGLNREQLKLANAMNVLAPGGGFVYYGDELGMTGSSGGWDDQSYRTPMPFESGRTNSQNYMGVGSDSYTSSGKSADQDAVESSSMYLSLASAINFKNSVPALYSASVSKTDIGREVCAMKYETGEEDHYLVLNASGSSQRVNVNGDFEDAFLFAGASASDGTLELPGFSLAVVKGKDLTFSQ